MDNLSSPSLESKSTNDVSHVINSVYRTVGIHDFTWSVENFSQVFPDGRYQISIKSPVFNATVDPKTSWSVTAKANFDGTNYRFNVSLNQESSDVQGIWVNVDFTGTKADGSQIVNQSSKNWFTRDSPSNECFSSFVSTVTSKVKPQDIFNMNFSLTLGSVITTSSATQKSSKIFQEP